MVYFENAQYIICIMVIDGCLYVFTIRKISISWSAPLRHQVVCWFCLWNDVMHTEVCWHLESLFCFHTLSCILDREMKQIYWFFFFFFLIKGPKGNPTCFSHSSKLRLKERRLNTPVHMWVSFILWTTLKMRHFLQSFMKKACNKSDLMHIVKLSAHNGSCLSVFSKVVS